jgi:hypothetical protein
MSKRIWAFSCIIIFFSFSLSGCYYFSATKEMKAAEQSLTELKAAGGQAQTPYEYCSAESFLGNAMREAAESDYAHAKEFAIRSKAAAQAGLAQVKKK